jgi:uncharacterized membrane protein (DUF4010 family)
METYDDPALELEAEIKRNRTRARIYAASAVLALPVITLGVYWAWQHVRLGLAGGIVLALVMLQRTTRRALAGRGANK